MASHIVPIMQPATSSGSAPVQMAQTVSAPVEASSSTSPKLARGTSVKIFVPLDLKPTVTTTRKILRRDSLERREALLKGKEGSRQRRRWENGESTSYL